METLKQIFSWWSGQTIGVRFFTWRKGEHVGTDDAGNRYYRAKSALPDSIPERRWVVYNGYAEASAIPPGWHGWIHHRVANPPSANDPKPREWQLPHQANLTGSHLAYRPPGSIVGAAPAQLVAADYKPWRPE